MFRAGFWHGRLLLVFLGDLNVFTVFGYGGLLSLFSGDYEGIQLYYAFRPRL